MTTPRVLYSFWTISLVLVGVALVILTLMDNISLANGYSSTPVMLFAIAAIGFIAEYVDSSLGMGYGTTLTPVLLIFGFSPLQVVPAILLSELLSGISSGLLHHRLGNVDISRGTKANRIMWILAMCSIGGSVFAVFLAVNLPPGIVKLYIGAMILAMGIFILISRRITASFSWSRITVLGTVAAFNKGISGGGYGPLITGGQIIIGIPGKNAVGITSLAEGLVCVVALGLYMGLGGEIYWSLALPLSAGALLSVPAAVWTVKIVPEQFLRRYIGYATTFLGALTLIKVI